jgi:hypothetical protein
MCWAELKTELVVKGMGRVMIAVEVMPGLGLVMGMAVML